MRIAGAISEVEKHRDFSSRRPTPARKCFGRTAAYRKREVTWAEMMKANEKLDFDLRGLKV
jgi:hypothetical protein